MSTLRFAVWCLVLAPGCRCAADEPQLATKQPIGRSAPAPSGCTFSGDEFTLAVPGPEKPPNAAADPELENPDILPFAVEVGGATADAQGIWLPYVLGQERAPKAGVLRVTDTLTGSRSVELGSGEAGPAHVALGVSGAVVALPFNRGKQRGFRVGTLMPDGVTWGPEVLDPGAIDDSTAFDLVARGEQFALVWDTWDAKASKSRIAAAFFGAAPLPAKLEATLLTLPSDAESPRVLARPEGFWLTWIASATGSEREVDDDENARRTPSYLSLLALGPQGAPAGAERALTPTDGFARSYDVAAAHAGPLLFTWRDEPAVSGVEGGRLFWASSEQTTPLRVRAKEAIAGTAPSLVFDPNPGGGGPHGWLSVESGDGDTLLSALSIQGAPSSVLRRDGKLARGAVLGALAGRLLVGEPRGRNLQLRWLRCPAVESAADGGVAP